LYQIHGIWEVDHPGDNERCKEFDSVTNRKLLWHGTKAISVENCIKEGLKTGLQSGVLGKGIYLSDISKSLVYTDGPERYIFLVEAALGEEHHVTKIDFSLEAPNGKGCVVGLGKYELKEKTIRINGRDILMPTETTMKKQITSRFEHTEFVVYNPKQLRILYLCLFRPLF
jgi:poly [ADP-ribose] polymerase